MWSWPTAIDQSLLAPIALPPPGGGDTGSSSLALRAALSLALLIGVFVVAAVVLLGAVGLNLLLFQAGRVHFGLVLGTLAIVAALGKAVWSAVRAPSEPDDEVEVSPQDEPELHEQIGALATQVETRPPDRIVLIPSVNAYVREFGPLLGMVPGKRTLAIGTPLLDTLTVSQLQAVLAHELGHLAGGDTRLGPLTYRTEQVLVTVVRHLGDSLPGRLFIACWKLQHRVSSKVRRRQELVADRAAVRVAGRQSIADALRTVKATAIGQEILNQAYLGPLLAAGHQPRDLRDGLRHVLSERWNDITEHLDDPEQGDPYASHPPTAQRVERVAALAETHVGGTDDRAARVLLREPDRWIAAVDDAWLGLVTQGKRLDAIEWSEWPAKVVAEEQQARAAVVDGALARLGMPPGLEGLSETFDAKKERDLAVALVQSGWRTGGPDERTVVLRSAIEAAAASAALNTAGFSWQLSWSGPIALRAPSGATVELTSLATQALEGDWVPLLEGLELKPEDLIVQGGDVVPAVAPAAVEALPLAELWRASVPQPPFASVGVDTWEATMPASGIVLPKHKVRVELDAITLDGTRIAFDQLEHFAVRPGSERGGGITYTIELTDATGAKAKAKMSSATVRGGKPIVDTVEFLWNLVRATAGPRLCQGLGQALSRGQSVVVGGLLLEGAGVRLAKRRNESPIPWSSVGDPQVYGREIGIPVAGGKPLVVPLGETDAFVLFDAIPELRTRFG